MLIFGCAGSLLLHELFPGCGEGGLLSGCGVRSSHCGDVSCCVQQGLGHTGFSSCGSQVVGRRLSSCGTWGLLPCLFNFCAEYIIRNARLDEAPAGIKIAGRNINNLRYADDTTLMAETKELNSVLKEKEESEKAGLKLNIQKTKIMASGPITSRQIDGETLTDFIFGTPKSLQMVTAAMKLTDTYSLEGKL